MVKTIQVDDQTLELLKDLKLNQGYKTYNELIRSLIINMKSLRTSKKGKFPRLKEFERNTIDR